jgi:hypothetical protein
MPCFSSATIEVDNHVQACIPGELQVGEHLCDDGWDEVHSTAFDFDDDRSLHLDIKSIAHVEFYFTIDQRKSDLGFYAQAHADQFIGKAGFICAFQQPWSKVPMNPECSLDDLIIQFVLPHLSEQ